MRLSLWWRDVISLSRSIRRKNKSVNKERETLGSLTGVRTTRDISVTSFKLWFLPSSSSVYPRWNRLRPRDWKGTSVCLGTFPSFLSGGRLCLNRANAAFCSLIRVGDVPPECAASFWQMRASPLNWDFFLKLSLVPLVYQGPRQAQRGHCASLNIVTSH